MKLNRLLAKHLSLGRSGARREILAGRVSVNGTVSRDEVREIRRFDRVEWEGVVVQPGLPAVYVMLHKPAGWVCANIDAQHPTVLELIDLPEAAELHVAGRLDRFSTGLVLLTNDGAWSKALTDPAFKQPKTYHVRTASSIPQEAVEAFERGFYFHTEDLTTRPAKLERLSDTEARVTLWEGRYHQIKRMFHRVGCRVMALHRESIGPLTLDPDLKVGQWRHLSDREVRACRRTNATDRID